jgi:membrane-anchored glycerophosphoryl diester phosphodiesterase (GDPDase)
MIKATDKTKEGLLRKLRLYNLIGLGVFFAVTVALVWQFSILSHQRKLQKEYPEDIAEMQEQTQIKENEAVVYGSQEWLDLEAAKNGQKRK